MAQRKFPEWARVFNPDIGNGDPNIDEPNAAKIDSGWIIEKPFLQYMNWLQNLAGRFIRGNNEIKLVADAYEAEAGEIVILDNGSGVATLFLPAAPLNGQWVRVSAIALYTTFNATVDGNGNDVMEAANTSVELDIDVVIYEFRYNSSSTLWEIRIVGNVGVV